MVRQSSHNSAQLVVPPPCGDDNSHDTQAHTVEQSTGKEPINEALKPCKIYPNIDHLTDDFAVEPMKIRHGLPPPVH